MRDRWKWGIIRGKKGGKFSTFLLKSCIWNEKRWPRCCWKWRIFGYASSHPDARGIKWKMEILDRFDMLLKFWHNSLVRAPIDVIQDVMEIKETYLQLSCFEFSIFKLNRGQNQVSRWKSHCWNMVIRMQKLISEYHQFISRCYNAIFGYYSQKLKETFRYTSIHPDITHKNLKRHPNTPKTIRILPAYIQMPHHHILISQAPIRI